MMGRSLAHRLLLGAALWLTVALAGSWVALTTLFHDHLDRQTTAEINTHLNQLIANLVFEADGTLIGARPLSDPRFARPYSGLYWQALPDGGDGGEPLRSRSLWDVNLALPPDDLADGELHRHVLPGPDGTSVLALERTVRPPAGGSVRLAVALDRALISEPLTEFGRALGLSLAVIGAGILCAALAQVALGLRPLVQLRTALALVRAGAADRIEGRWPAEVEPLVADFNAVLAHDAAILKRAREQAGNLAHALKTPLSVLLNRVRRLEPSVREDMEADLAEIARQINRRLTQARIAAGPAALGLATPVRERLDALARTITCVHSEKPITFEIDATADLMAPCDRQDFDELVGNLMDNAAKWTRERIGLRARSIQGFFTLTIADDGPGLPDAERQAVFERGRRLDERTQGTGLGLAIVRDIVESYDGTVELAPSAWGGLAATVRLPTPR